MLQTWRRFGQLSAFKKAVAVEAAGALVTIRLGLRVFGFSSVRDTILWLTPSPSPATSASEVLIERARTIAQMHTAVARRLSSRPNCLENSLALWTLLRSRRMAAELQLGGRTDAGQFEAHAWVEYFGVVLTDLNGEYLDYIPFEHRVAPLETQPH
jgi:hypothetical protein